MGIAVVRVVLVLEGEAAAGDTRGIVSIITTHYYEHCPNNAIIINKNKNVTGELRRAGGEGFIIVDNGLVIIMRRAGEARQAPASPRTQQ